jgi:hypothetical protein
VAPKLANIENGEISLVPKLRDIWCRNSRTKPRTRSSSALPPRLPQSPTSYETTTASNAMLARYSAHHEPFYRALRAHKIAIP